MYSVLASPCPGKNFLFTYYFHTEWNVIYCFILTAGDYKMIVGTRIPFQKLGFQSLEQFLKSIPNVSISCDRNGQMILDAIPTKKSAHLAALIEKQKSAPKRPTRYVSISEIGNSASYHRL